MRDHSIITKKMVRELKSILMEIYTLGSFKTEKNMGQVNSTGLICRPRIQKLINSFSTMRANGGEDCRMVREFIKNWEVIYIWEYSKTGLNMEKAQSGLEMEIFTKGSL